MRKPRTKKRGAVAAEPPLAPGKILCLQEFLRFGIGDGHLTWWEEGLLNNTKHRLYSSPVWLTTKQQHKIREVMDKLRYDRPDDPLPTIDPDGFVENDDPDG